MIKRKSNINGSKNIIQDTILYYIIRYYLKHSAQRLIIQDMQNNEMRDINVNKNMDKIK